MRLFNLFKKKRQEQNKRSDQTIGPIVSPEPTLRKIESEIETCKTQLNTVNIVLQKHDDQLAEHHGRMDQHSEQFEKLEEKVMATHIPAPTTLPAIQSIDIPHSSTTSTPLPADSTQKFDINRFSEQQKRILAVFFQNQDMTLSYMDIGKILNKSPHTIKNQMREIRLKADLFETSIGEQSRRRFKLKNDLRVEKYLNVG